MKPSISVIVPVYQVKKYLSRCLDSLLNQTYPLYEIVLVDDGSSDGGEKICDEYAQRYEKIKVIHQKNQGLGPARNTGVKHSSGDYVVFVDSDDYVSEDFLQYLMMLVVRYQVPVAVTGVAIVEEDGGKMQELTAAEEIILPTENALKEMCYGELFGVAAWAKIYRRDLTEKYPYPAIVHEDLATTYKIISECAGIAVGSRVGYYYVQRSGSLMNQKISEKHLSGLKAAEEQLNYMKKYYPEVVPAAVYRCGLKMLEYVPRVLENQGRNREIFKVIQKNMRKYLLKIWKNSRATFLFKLRCTAVFLGYHPARILWKSVWMIKGEK